MQPKRSTTPNEIAHAPEATLWSGACSHWHYFGHWFFGLLLVAGTGAGVYFNRDALAPQMPWVWLAPVAVLLVVISVIAWKRAFERYQVTPSRVIIQTGRVVRDSNEIRIQDIRSINVTKRGLSGFFGIGSIEFSSAATDDAEVTFTGIANADGVRDMVRNLQTPEVVKAVTPEVA
jgi:membrane protein YdbS with pleckstrin-like domain